MKTFWNLVICFFGLHEWEYIYSAEIEGEKIRVCKYCDRIRWSWR